MSKPVTILLKLKGASGSDDQRIIVSASTDPAKAPDTFREIARLRADIPPNADGEITHTVTVDAELPTWFGVSVYSEFHKEVSGFLSSAFMPPTPAASIISLSVQRV